MEKDERKKYEKIIINISAVSISITILILCMIFIYTLIVNQNIVYAEERFEDINETKISNAEILKINEIIERNSNVREEYIIQEAVLEYTTTYIEDYSLASGVIQVVQEGREGVEEVTIIKTYESENLISEEQVSSKIIKAAIGKTVKIGTGNFKNYANPNVGDYIYVSSDRVDLKIEPNYESEKIITLGKNQEMEILEITGEWYKVFVKNQVGYIRKENTISSNPATENNSTQNNSSNAKVTLAFDMQLNKPSGYSLEEFKEILTDVKDVNGIFSQNAEFFYYIEQQYNINGLFVAAVAIHESGWGTSQIANDKNNLFGYGAYDADPYNKAYTFNNYAEGIDLVARVFVKYYLNPKGTSIYNGEIAGGTYYNGATLSGVNTRYATDKNWANAVYQHMQYLYNK